MSKTLKNIFSVLFLIFSSLYVSGQTDVTPYDKLPEIEVILKPSYSDNYPLWGKMLYQYPVNFKKIQSEYQQYVKENGNIENAISRYYKIWSRIVSSYADINGNIVLPSSQDLINIRLQKQQKLKKDDNSNSDWTFLGPKVTHWLNTGAPGPTDVAPWQVNVYTIDVFKGNNDIVYCGTETGFVNKTINAGKTWELMARDYIFGGGISCVKIHPTNSNTVYVAGGGQIHKSVDGGRNWQPMLDNNVSFQANHIIINPENPNELLVSTEKGVYISNDAAQTWVNRTAHAAYDIEYKPGDPQVIYAIEKGADGNFRLIESVNGGDTFSEISTFPSIKDVSGALIAVTPANSNLIIANMLSSDSTPRLYRGVYDNNTWTWTEIIKCNTDAFPYNNGQGYFDLVVEIDPENENKFMVGTTDLFKTNDDGKTFDRIGGYSGRFSIHPDIQDMRWLKNNKVWVATDGGTSFSSDAFETDFQPRINGLIGSDMWGFDQGWNEDLVVGGRYHNGNTAIAEFYNGIALRMGGAESPTGWVIKGKSRHAAFNDLGEGFILPRSEEHNPDGRFPFNKFPNMDEYGGKRGNLIQHPNYYNRIFLGEGNTFWKSTDGGLTFEALKIFSGKVRWCQMSTKNPDVIYVDVVGKGLYKSEDQGVTWVLKPSLSSGQNGGSVMNGNTQFVISPYDENTIYATFTNGTWSADKGKIFKSTDGGDNWDNITDGLDEYTKCLAIQPTTDGKDLIYLFSKTKNGMPSNVYYRKEGMNEWKLFAKNYPNGFFVNLALPFFRDGKIRVAGNGGIWESPLQEPDFEPIINPCVQQKEFKCTKDTLYFNDHSVLNHTGVTEWKWEITPKPKYISNPNIRNPKVVLGNIDSYNVTLTVQVNGKTYSKTIENMVSAKSCPSIYDCGNPAELPKNEWTLIYADSQNTASGAVATNAFDNDTGTIWHTKWSGGSDPYPHEIQIDLGNTYNLSEFTYVPRSSGFNGTVKKYELYLSMDKENWGEKVASGQFEKSKMPKKVKLSVPVKARYMRFVALSEVNGNDWTSAAELTLVGCVNDEGFTLPSNNFSIQTSSETCRDSNNGKISINAKEDHEYTLTLKKGGTETKYQFTSELEIENLSSGVYQLCFTVKDIEEDEFDRCYDIVISEPEDLSVLSKFNLDKQSITLKMSNGERYFINLNGEEILTGKSEITLKLKQGMNVISVRTDKDCQGTFEKRIMLNDNIVAFPNPFTDFFYLNLGDVDVKYVKVQVYEITGKLIQSRVKAVKTGYVVIDGTHFKSGQYYVKVTGDGLMNSFKIVKK